MSSQFPSNNPTAYFGVLPTSPGQNWYRDRDPNATDYKGYAIGDRWINKNGQSAWTLVANAAHIATWIQATNQFASNAETIAGVISDKAVSPSSLLAKLGPQTAHGVLIGEGTSNAVTSTSAGSVQQYLISKGAASDPVWFTPPAFSTYKSANTINFTGNGLQAKIVFDTIDFDTTTSYDQPTATYTAPITGKYLFQARARTSNCTIATSSTIVLVTTTKTYSASVDRDASGANLNVGISQVVAMSAGDTATCNIQNNGEAADTNTLIGDAFHNTTFSGHWVGP